MTSRIGKCAKILAEEYPTTRDVQKIGIHITSDYDQASEVLTTSRQYAGNKWAGQNFGYENMTQMHIYWVARKLQEGDEEVSGMCLELKAQ
jgi:D-alanyl-D-alanine carboxypeptidase